MDRIFLIGYRGSGKTTVARLLADALGWQAVDADEYLERKYGRTIRQIFADEGEGGFRDKESAVLAELCQLTKQVVATGGGVVLRGENRDRLKSGQVVWLKADAKTLFARMKSDPTTPARRPALTTGGLAEVEQLLRAREPYYAQCADFSVDCAHLTAQQVADEILDKLGDIRS